MRRLSSQSLWYLSCIWRLKPRANKPVNVCFLLVVNSPKRYKSDPMKTGSGYYVCTRCQQQQQSRVWWVRKQQAMQTGKQAPAVFLWLTEGPTWVAAVILRLWIEFQATRAKSSRCDAGGGGGRTQLTERGIYCTGQIWGNSYTGLVGLCSASSVPENQ